jgi:hypothetical protein
MAWTSLGSTPGSAASNLQINPEAPILLNHDSTLQAAPSDAAYSLGVDVPRALNSNSPLGFPDIINQGWINFSSAGGGGSTRPSTGFLYPRGN